MTRKFCVFGFPGTYTNRVDLPHWQCQKTRPRHGLQKDEIMSLYGGHELYPAVAGTYWLRKLEFETLPLFLAGGSIHFFVETNPSRKMGG
jgi:hypothetical protein